MQGLLPLFPLQVVLLPGAELPLHIFEDRYKEMIGEVMRGRLEFGVVLAVGGEKGKGDKGIANTGCSATIDKVLRQYEDGRMDILTRGRRRFEIVSLNDERNFLRGAVEFFDDDESSAPAELQKRAIDGYNELQALSSSEPLGETPGEASAPPLSFRLAQPIPDISFRQALLATRSEADRLRQITKFLPGYMVRQRRIQRVKNAAPRNGHGYSFPEVE